MDPGTSPIRSPRITIMCDVCRQMRYWPARVLLFEDAERRHGQFARVCARCYPHIYLLYRPAISTVVRRTEEARRAWYRHVGPILFDQVRDGFPEPPDLASLVRWLEVERERQALIARGLVLELGAELEYEPPTAVCWVLAACTGRLAA